MTKVIGLTGGIGSGKTTIGKYFESFGIPVYIADTESKKILGLPETAILIQNKFGDSVFEKGKINNSKLAQLVFNDKQKLQQLNSILHPLVKKHFEQWLRNHPASPIVIKEAAILFESGSYLDCDSVITVVAPLESRIERVVNRDNISREMVLQRMNNQWSDEQRVAKSDFVIENSDAQQARQQAEEILKKLIIQ
jgi:dephospho-CoA kinase